MKLTEEAAREAHARYLGDPLLTLAVLGAQYGITPSGLHHAWKRLGLPCCPAADRGGNVRRQEVSKVSRAEAEAHAEAFHAKRAAAGCTKNGLKVTLVKAAWERYRRGEGSAELAAEIGCHPQSLIRAWHRMGLSPRAGRQEAERRRMEPVTFRLHGLVTAGLPLEEAAQRVGLKPAAAKWRLKQLEAKRAQWVEMTPRDDNPDRRTSR